MSFNIADVWGDDAFEMVSLTAAINDVDSIPGRAGQLVFDRPEAFTPINVPTVAIERVAEDLKLIQTSPRGAPAEKERADKRNMIGFTTPHIQIEDTINADSFVGVREFGTNEPASPQLAINHQLSKMTNRMDYTLEFHRIGALKGIIRDADGSVLTDLFTSLGFQNSDGLFAPETFDFDLTNLGADAEDIRVKCQDLVRFMKRNAKTTIPPDARPWAFVGDDFFDALVSNRSVKASYNGFAAAENILAENYAHGIFEFGGVMWENYCGSDDNSTIAIADDEARFFWTGVQNLYAEYYAPAAFIETVNTPGLRRYAKVAPDLKFNKSAEIHAETNPLPLCLRPATLCRGTM